MFVYQRAKDQLIDDGSWRKIDPREHYTQRIKELQQGKDRASYEALLILSCALESECNAIEGP